ncbi:MAG: hypothetical protein ACO3EF_10405 [Vulcanococcus sp.]
MSFVGLLLALVAGFVLWVRLGPGFGPAQTPQARPSQTINQARQAADQFGQAQEQRAKRGSRLDYFGGELPR